MSSKNSQFDVNDDTVSVSSFLIRKYFCGKPSHNRRLMRLIVPSGFLIRQILEKEPAKDQPFLAGEFTQGQPVPAFIYSAYGNRRFSDSSVRTGSRCFLYFFSGITLSLTQGNLCRSRFYRRGRL